MAHIRDLPFFAPELVSKDQQETYRAALSHRVLSCLFIQNGLFSQVATQTSGIQEQLNSLENNLSALWPVKDRILAKRIPNKQTLSTYLHPSVTSFELSLELHGVVPNPVCKGKYFSFEVRLQTQGVSLPTSEEIQVRAAISSADTVPQQLTVNMRGQPLFKGGVQTTVRFDPNERVHKGHFKVLITEVTSHFRNGWVFLVVTADEGGEFLARTGYSVKPLVVEHLVSKAKETICSRWRAKSKACDIQPDPISN